MRLSNFALPVRLACCSAILVALVTIASGLNADDVAPIDDFEGLNMLPFTVVTGAGDGTDWTDQIPNWTIDNSLQTGTTSELAYAGWTAMDIDSWIDEQGSQIGRDTFVGSGTNNTILVADPDAWDDYTSGADTNGYNSFITKEYDLTGFDESTLSITMDYQFATEDNQMGSIEVSFDGGTTWQVLAMFDSTAVSNGTFFNGSAGVDFFNAGTDFSADSSTMQLRLGCFDSGNDWWFVADNITVATTDGFSDTEDFEGLTLVPFTVASLVGDGTDFASDITNWVVDNSGTVDSNGFQGFCKETGYDGWKAVDVFGWVNEQGVQAGRTLFNVIDPNNTVLLADGDAFYDFECTIDGDGNIVEGFEGNSINTYISRTYDVSGFDNCTLQFSFEYEFAVENQQLGVAEVSFDGGQTWEEVARFDNDGGNTANNTVLAGQTIATAGAEFSARQTNNVTFRFGYLDAGNNWWFAVDNVLLTADPIAYVKGDANGDGNFNTLDVTPFVTAVLTNTFDPAIDMNCDGALNSLDITPFIGVLLDGN